MPIAGLAASCLGRWQWDRAIALGEVGGQSLLLRRIVDLPDNQAHDAEEKDHGGEVCVAAGQGQPEQGRPEQGQNGWGKESYHAIA
jgi:hypothetical protein